jgi:hypothetical protein
VGEVVSEALNALAEAELEVRRSATEDWQLVADQLAAAAGEDRRTADETCPLLLAAAGREPSDAAALWSHAGQDRSVALARRVGEPTTGSDFSDARGTGRQSVAGIGRKRVSFGLWGSRERQNATIRGPWEHLEVQIRLPVAFGGGQVYLMGRAGDR